MPDYTRLSKITDYGNPGISTKLEVGAYSFLQWGFLGIGAFTNTAIGQSGNYGGDLSRLRPVNDVRYGSGVVWESARKDWVWESGIERAEQPTQISGIFINSVFHPYGSGYTINYPEGRIIFSTAQSVNSTIRVAHSSRHVHFYKASHPGWQEIQYQSFRVDDNDFLRSSGMWNNFAQNRMQLPCVVVEAIVDVDAGGYEIGESTRLHRQPVKFHVLAENDWDRKQIHDVLVDQYDKRFCLLDLDRMRDDNKFPLVADKYPRPSALMYPSLVAPTGEGGYRDKTVMVKDINSSSSFDGPFLWGAEVYWTVEAII